MIYESLDPNLTDGVEAICQSDWAAAQSILTRRLDETRHLGCRRATLFLLAFVARESGHGEVSNHLLEESRRTPADLAEPRILSEANPLLQNEWLAFNHWSPKESEPSFDVEPTLAEIDWATLLDSVLEGRSAEFERRWSGHLIGDSPDRHVLWNLLALAYLENGDLRTYEEMYSQRQIAPQSYEPPAVLLALLEQASLDQVLHHLVAGLWLTTSLFVPSQTPSSVPATNGEILEWRGSMETGFSLLAVGRAFEAAQQFGLLISQPLTNIHRCYTVNALALALFQSGEYAGAEEALRDLRNFEQTFDPAADPKLQEVFESWLHSAGAASENNSPFHNPFGSAPPCEPSAPLVGEPTGQKFSEAMASVIGHLQTQDLPSALRILRGLLTKNDTSSVTERFVVALFFAGTALLDGDHINAQEGIEDASRILEGGRLEDATLSQVQTLLRANGAKTLAEKFELSQMHTVDPWRDFPLDFQRERAGSIDQVSS